MTSHSSFPMWPRRSLDCFKHPTHSARFDYFLISNALTPTVSLYNLATLSWHSLLIAIILRLSQLLQDAEPIHSFAICALLLPALFEHPGTGIRSLECCCSKGCSIGCSRSTDLYHFQRMLSHYICSHGHNGSYLLDDLDTKGDDRMCVDGCLQHFTTCGCNRCHN